MTYRTTVSMTEHMKDRVEAYAETHGATVAGALVALAARALDGLAEQRDFVAECPGRTTAAGRCEHGRIRPHAVTRDAG